MKIDRLLSIVIVLLNRRSVQAKDLAELFEVSVRTIYRDIDSLNMAGIPIVTQQGSNGGIRIAEGYRLDRSLLSNDELASIVTALQSLASAHQTDSTHLLVEKIHSIIPPAQAETFQFKTSQYRIDLTPWGNQHKFEEKLALLKQSIETLTQVTFTYCDAAGTVTERTVEPHTLVMKGQKWYLYAYCTQRQAFRFFKLYRIKELNTARQSFKRRPVDLEAQPWDEEWHKADNLIRLELAFTPQARYMAEERFGVDELYTADDGSLRVELHYPEDEWLYGFLLSFGTNVTVIKPIHVRERIRAMAQHIQQLYDGDK
ncbi:YafY family transcriptional regulator [Paenibacillus sp. ACRRX]|uniref:helix-turn-helix transcriptional regulator n=1 Tax=unclassified Paenibacillus TaxID=185978 RepID=UPI001EF528C7|nr:MULTISPECIES: YafY family protein [unclassified Paenibacillus]MCG7408895.1 YafY family transcriptional regulator [Paenibacillus sp. ACRRX]MDK8182194.1 YafY family protein [Paenibacillus sp. UMB4589-SE434]